MKRIITFVVLVIIIVVGLILAYKTDNEAVAPTTEEETMEEEVQKEVDTSYETHSVKEETDDSIVDIEFPIVANANVNQEIDNFIQTSLADFKQSIADFGSPTVPGRKYMIQIWFNQEASDKYVTYVFQTSLDMGGAHPNSFYNTMTFDADGNLVDIEEVLKREFGSADVIDQIAPLVQEILREDLGDMVNEEMLKAGTEAELENFSDFYVTDYGITFLFEPYAVAAYAASSREATVDFSEIK